MKSTITIELVDGVGIVTAENIDPYDAIGVMADVIKKCAKNLSGGSIADIQVDVKEH